MFLNKSLTAGWQKLIFLELCTLKKTRYDH